VARNAIEWLRKNQSHDGGWWGRWGVNYIYGTWSALMGLRAIGVNMNEPWIQNAASWIRSKQNEDGGWGESPLSDRDPSWRGRGTSTASQTDWSLLQNQAAIANIDLVVNGTLSGKVHGLLYQPSAGNYISNQGVLYTKAQLQTLVLAGDTLTIMGVYPGTGRARAQ